MFAHGTKYFKCLFGLLAVVAALVAFGCGNDQAATTIPGVSSSEPDVADADPDDLEVISGWVEALSEGDVEGAAGFFALPSVAENGPLVTKIEDLDDAIAFNEALPCSATVIAAETSGEFTTATFELGERPGGACGPGVGGEAATSFVIEDGKISEWRRVGGEIDRDNSGATTA